MILVVYDVNVRSVAHQANRRLSGAVGATVVELRRGDRAKTVVLSTFRRTR